MNRAERHRRREAKAARRRARRANRPARQGIRIRGNERLADGIDAAIAEQTRKAGR